MDITSNNLFNKYKNKGLTGLANVGNSCYINSCIQVLSHTYELNLFLDNESYKNNIRRCPDSVLLLEWDKLRALMWSENCTVAPWGFIKALRKVAGIKERCLFTGIDQNDVHEFLYFLIDCFHMSLAREVEMNIQGIIENDTDKLAMESYKMMKTMYKKEYSEMLNIFYGICISQLTSTDDAEILSVRPEPFSNLSLSIPDNKETVSIFDCLDEYCKNERLEGDEAWYNEKTNKKQPVDKKMVFWSLPNILIMDLKRFNNNSRKLQKLVHTPLENNDFSKYVIGYNKQSYIYDLYAVCNHMGGCNGGHYTAYVKNANGKWYNFNDTNISEIQPDEIITPKTYCLFYRKKK